MSIRSSWAWQMKHRGVIPSIGSVIGWFQVLVFAVVAVEPAGEELVKPEEQVAKHRRLLRHHRCGGSYGRYECSRNSSYSAACNNRAGQSSSANPSGNV